MVSERAKISGNKMLPEKDVEVIVEATAVKVAAMEKCVDGMKSQLEKNLNTLDRLEQLWKRRWIERAKEKGIQIDETQSAEVIASLVVEGSWKPSDPSRELIQQTIRPERYDLPTREIESPTITSDPVTKSGGSSKSSYQSLEPTQLTEKNDRWILNPQRVMQVRCEPQTQMTGTPISLLDGENTGSRDRHVEQYFERGKFTKQMLFGFDSSQGKEVYQQGEENRSETELNKCAHQVFDQMTVRGKGNSKKKKKRWKTSVECQEGIKKRRTSLSCEGIQDGVCCMLIEETQSHDNKQKREANKDVYARQMFVEKSKARKRVIMHCQVMECVAEKLNKTTSVEIKRYKLHKIDRRLLLMATKRKKKRTRGKKHERRGIKPHKHGNHKGRMRQMKRDEDRKVIRLELVFARRLWEYSIAVEKLAKWKKHRFKQTHNKQKGKIKSRLLVYMRSAKGLQLNGLAKQYWELLLAAKTMKRAKTKCKRGNILLDITSWTKFMIKRKKHKVKHKNQNNHKTKIKGIPSKDQLVFPRKHSLEIKYLENLLSKWRKEEQVTKKLNTTRKKMMSEYGHIFGVVKKKGRQKGTVVVLGKFQDVCRRDCGIEKMMGYKNRNKGSVVKKRRAPPGIAEVKIHGDYTCSVMVAAGSSHGIVGNWLSFVRAVAGNLGMCYQEPGSGWVVEHAYRTRLFFEADTVHPRQIGDLHLEDKVSLKGGGIVTSSYSERLKGLIRIYLSCKITIAIVVTLKVTMV